MQRSSSKHRWDAVSQVSIQCRMCVHQMIPKRRRAACGEIELHTTSVAICNALGETAAHSIHCSTNRVKVVPDDRDAAAAARPSVQHTDLCTFAENQPRTGVTPSVHPLAGMETDPVLHCLVHLREPARRRCIQLRREYLEQLVGQRDEPHIYILASPRKRRRSALRAVTTRYLTRYLAPQNPTRYLPGSF